MDVGPEHEVVAKYLSYFIYSGAIYGIMLISHYFQIPAHEVMLELGALLCLIYSVIRSPLSFKTRR